MPRFPSELAPHVRPGERSIGAPWSPLMPPRSFMNETVAESFGTSDNATNWSPYVGREDAQVYRDPRGFSHTPRHDNWVTPYGPWNLLGINGQGSGEPWPITAHPSQGIRYQFGWPKSQQVPWVTTPGVIGNMPSVPPPMPFLGSGL